MPSEGNIKIRVKSGDSEAEIEAPVADIHEAIRLIPEVLGKLPEPRREAAAAPMRAPVLASVRAPRAAEPLAAAAVASSGPSPTPAVTVEKGDSLSDVISKFFSDQWGGSPRKLMEVREALQSYGLNYPKQSVAVALLRLAKGSKIRRFKAEGGEYVYTASTGAIRPAAGVQPAMPQQAAEADPGRVLNDEGPPEEQLNLDVPVAK